MAEESSVLLLLSGLLVGTVWAAIFFHQALEEELAGVLIAQAPSQCHIE